jgi:hypothetical protein
LTPRHRAQAGGRGEAVDLYPAATGFVTVQVRLGVSGRRVLAEISRVKASASQRISLKRTKSSPAVILLLPIQKSVKTLWW